jgi:predicted DNA-binding WGR domain protein
MPLEQPPPLPVRLTPSDRFDLAPVPALAGSIGRRPPLRYDALESIQPTLFGEWALLREWGRIGSAGRVVSTRYGAEHQAAAALAAQLKAKRRHGYLEPGAPHEAR